jgi:hypothetical protein
MEELESTMARSMKDRVMQFADIGSLAASLAVVLAISGIGMFVWDLFQSGAPDLTKDANYSPVLGERVLTLSLHVRAVIAIFSAAILVLLGLLYKIVDQTSPKPVESAKLFNNHVEFFESLRREIKDNPPKAMTSSAIRRIGQASMPGDAVTSYYAAHEEWLAKEPSAKAERFLPKIPTADTSKDAQDLRQFIRQNLTAAQSTGRLDLYEVEWDFKFPMINMAILDERIVYLALLPVKGGVSGGKWVRIESAATARFFKEGYAGEIRTLGTRIS